MYRPLRIWIGCNDINEEGRFVWIHNNQSLTFSNWTPHEPNNYRGEDCCIMGWFYTSEWNDIKCSGAYGDTFICKI